MIEPQCLQKQADEPRCSQLRNETDAAESIANHCNQLPEN